MRLTSPAELKALLERHGFRFSKALGQNFLIEPSVPRRIAEASGADENTLALEVGPGVGCLTSELARRAKKVVAIELDNALRGVLDETLGGLENVEIVWGDAAKLDLAALVRERAGALRPVVCANLPYSVTTPLLAAFIEAGCFERMTVMIQREVAQRLAAAPGTKDYGAFTVFVNWHCEVKRLFDVPPECFMPRPRVTSSVVALTPRAEPPCAVRDEALMFRCVRAAFSQRRKTLSNALSNGLGGFERAEVLAALDAAGIDPRSRGETLSGADFARLSDALASLRAK
ncbi:MAG TPA: 16S rRNA (adenine(1518)-N(6)/adenine(1519)-N(6))-dimethyltransferase RsmA [Candidatus Scatomorpha merdipullorum]|uniref:Ribosomal RNA small subunit methyltransferase A n=1 Tax=Candidatus Scatomorpha merdipullorum TaxID=2840927 RepID=A0A9D1FDG3_9FIRM|nr:16S rRNA (adenine(1518)-N(6)/adenine(1519)-N(6))-dimethyltransferase RsmA [Candidatus Scatomorpha merdipullorum]